MIGVLSIRTCGLPLRVEAVFFFSTSYPHSHFVAPSAIFLPHFGQVMAFWTFESAAFFAAQPAHMPSEPQLAQRVSLVAGLSASAFAVKSRPLFAKWIVRSSIDGDSRNKPSSIISVGRC